MGHHKSLEAVRFVLHFMIHTGVIPENQKNEQVLDRLQVERERGITVKAQSASLFYSVDGVTYLLNLVDTPVSACKSVPRITSCTYISCLEYLIEFLPLSSTSEFIISWKFSTSTFRLNVLNNCGWPMILYSCGLHFFNYILIYNQWNYM